MGCSRRCVSEVSGLPLLSWVATPEELNPSQNRVEEFFIGRLLRHLPTNIRPLLLADRGFGRASLIRLAQQMPTPHPLSRGLRDPTQGRPRISTGPAVAVQSETADYRGRLRDYPLRKRPYPVLAPNPLPLRRRGGDQPDPLFGPGAIGNPRIKYVAGSGIWPPP